MSWLFFIDESGQDHKNCPYEVRGGVVVHLSKLWAFVRSVEEKELKYFGFSLSEYGKEIKGSELLKKKRMEWAGLEERMEDDQRRKLCRSFFQKGRTHSKPERLEFAACGQASRDFCIGVFESLRDAGGYIFASVIPRDVAKRKVGFREEFLRKDQIYLLQRFHYFLESKREHGLLVFDEVEHGADSQYIKRLQKYFRSANRGKQMAGWISPVPLFVSSFMSIPVQIADLVIYAVNWGFRNKAMVEETRSEIRQEFEPWIKDLQYCNRGEEFTSYSIVYVPDPYGA